MATDLSVDTMKISLDGEWLLRGGVAGAQEIAVTVPGDNYSALESAGLIPDPYWRLNEEKVQWPVEKDWIFCRKFDVPPELLEHDAVILNFDSIDTVADIFLNGEKVGHAFNEFLRWRFDVKKTLRLRGNLLEVRIESHASAIADSQRRAPHKDVTSWGCNTLSQIVRLRKTQCSAGWDWGISLPVSGIYGETYLVGVNVATLEYLWDEMTISQDFAEVTLVAQFAPLQTASRESGIEVEFCFNGEKRSVCGTIGRGERPVCLSATFGVPEPRLWNPNGFGEQNLYQASVSYGAQTITRSVGLRTIKVVREKDGDGETFGFCVNGVDVFAKGANWIPSDAHPQRRTVERCNSLLESMAEAGMNMVRVWGGGFYEPDYFYEKCNRLGIMVWQDMMFACGVYPDDPEFLENVRAEMTHQVKRLRSNPSIALWCGDNENLMCTYVTRSHYALFDRLNQAEACAVREADPTRLFWPSSPCSGDRRYDDNFNRDIGDSHLWGISDSYMTFDNYLTTRARFVSEYGFASFPSLDLVKTFSLPGDWNASSRVMDCHQKSAKTIAGIFAMMPTYFRMPKDFDSTLFLSQVQQAFALKSVTERWHSQMPYCRGTLYWQLNDWWPVSSWSSIEYDGRWKPAHYAARRFFAPLTAMVALRGVDDGAEVRVIWDLPEKISATVEASLLSVEDGHEVFSQSFNAEFDGAGVRCFKIADFEHAASSREDLSASATFIIIKTRGTTLSGRTFRHEDFAMRAHFKHYELPDAELEIASVNKVEGGDFEIDVSAKRPSFFAWLSVADDPAGRFDDNLVVLTPGIRKFRYRPGRRMNADSLSDALSLRDLRGTYL